jgi:HEAT repeat protein
MLPVLIVMLAATGPAFDTSDMRAVELGLHALKMTPHDLSFAKTNVESELILPTVRRFLQEPLTLPVYAESTLENLRAVTILAGLVSTVVNLSEVEGLATGFDSEFLRSAQNDIVVTGVPPSVARAVRIIYNAAQRARPLLPRPDKAVFDAFALDTFHDDRHEMGINPELIRRDDDLELQDTELADAILNASDKFDRGKLMTAAVILADAVDEAIAELRTNTFTEEFQVEFKTDVGKIICGGIGRNVYTNDAFLIIDTGGDDVYLNSAGGANGFAGLPISVLIDVAGNDQYVGRKNFSQGAGVFGIGILADLGGDDVFIGRHLSQGAGFFGCGILMAGEGRQNFHAGTFCQGAGMFGAGMLWQRGGDTTYRAEMKTQGYASTQGVGLLLDESGNDVYIAGGKTPCPWLPGQYFSLAQGFAEGMRPYAGGGIGLLCDFKGDDRYIADVYGQGASYWYSLGLLLDAEGNDAYQAYQYCQGAGVHLSAGALIDWSGNDQYSAQAICQGGAHDYSVGTLIDRAGNDHYTAVSTAQGSAINNSFALLFDKAGDDFYAGRDPKQSQAAGHDGGKREYGSIALLLDFGGRDVYSQGQTDNAIWLKPLHGALVDTDFAGQAAGLPRREMMAGEPPALQKAARIYQLARVDPHHPIERLMRRAISDRPDADEAFTELKHLSTDALRYLLTRLDSPNVLLRAKVEEFIDVIGTNAVPALIDGIDRAKNEEVARLCCYFLARFETATNAILHVLPLLEAEKTRGTALYTLGHLHAREAFAAAMNYIDEPRELVRLRAAQALGRICFVEAASSPRSPAAAGRLLPQLQREAIPKLIRTLNDEFWSVRYAAEDALVAFGKPSIAPLRRAFEGAPSRARSHILEALARLGDRRALEWARSELRHEDPLVRHAVENQLNLFLSSRASRSLSPQK